MLLSVAYSDDLAASQSQVEFKVTPASCILGQAESFCKFDLFISFKLAGYKELCLEIPQLPNYNKCFSKQNTINEHLQIKANYDIIVRLINPIPIEQRVVAEQKISVAHYKEKSYRAKRQFGWSL